MCDPEPGIASSSCRASTIMVVLLRSGEERPKTIMFWECFFIGWLGSLTGSASDQRSEGCGFEAY